MPPACGQVQGHVVSENPPTSEPFGIDVVLSEGRAIVHLRGELDLATVSAVTACFSHLALQGEIDVAVDMSRLSFIDSTGLSAFVMAYKRFKALGGAFVVRNPPPHAMKLLEITGLVTLLVDRPNEEVSPAALAASEKTNHDCQPGSRCTPPSQPSPSQVADMKQPCE